MLPKSAPTASTADQPADASSQPGPSKGRDKQKKKKDISISSAAKPKKSKKRAASDAFSDTEIEGSQATPKKGSSPDTRDASNK